jgi:hypothetical protein
MTVSVNIDPKEMSKILKNSVDYSRGFLDGANLNMIVFNKKLSDIAAEALKKYIDTRARMSPESLHHVYEWNRVGDPSARLFEIDCQATKNTISLFGKFLPSTSISENSNEPFIDKANIMENKIAIEVEPRSSNVLAFEVMGEPVFTVNSVYIANPGGDEVAGSFGRAVDEFFDVYFNTTFLRQSGIFDSISNPKEFGIYFPSGAKGGGRSTGLNAGRKYMDIEGVTIT